MAAVGAGHRCYHPARRRTADRCGRAQVRSCTVCCHAPGAGRRTVTGRRVAPPSASTTGHCSGRRPRRWRAVGGGGVFITLCASGVAGAVAGYIGIWAAPGSGGGCYRPRPDGRPQMLRRPRPRPRPAIETTASRCRRYRRGGPPPGQSLWRSMTSLYICRPPA